MSLKHLFVAALLRLYPASWREQYGAELEDLILAQPLTIVTLVDVLWNGLRQRLRLTEPATYLGVLMMGVVADGLMPGLVSPSPGLAGFAGVLQPSQIMLPTLRVVPLDAGQELYVLLLLLCGCWTNLKYRGSVGRSARAGAKMTFIGGVPVMVLGALMLTGMTSVAVEPRVALAVLTAPLFALPISALWSAIGGQLGRRISYFRSRFARS